MEFLNSTVSFNTRICVSFPVYSHKLLIVNLRNPNNSVRLKIQNGRKLRLHSPLSLYSTNDVSRDKFRIAASFRRHGTRKNYLRKKLKENQHLQRVSPVPNPSHELNKTDVGSGIKEYSEIVEEECIVNHDCNVSGDIKESEAESREKLLGNSIMWNKLENWVEQYKIDSEFWGIGTGPIFIVYKDSEGKIERVVVNEDEIMRRGGVDPRSRAGKEAEDLADVDFKISFAKDLAKEISEGSNMITDYSSVAKFVSSGSKSTFMESISGVMSKTSMFPAKSRATVLLLGGLLVLWTIKGLFAGNDHSEKPTKLETEMLRRKLKARKSKENLVRGSVELIQDQADCINTSLKRPELDKSELLNSIVHSKERKNKLSGLDYSCQESKNFEDEIKEIRSMARHAREMEKTNSSLDIYNGEDDPALTSLLGNSVNPENKSAQEGTMQINTPGEKIELNGTESLRDVMNNSNFVLNSSDVNRGNFLTSDSDSISDQHIANSSRTKFKIITSIKEAREYLARKDHKLDGDHGQKVTNDEEVDSAQTISMMNPSACKMEKTFDSTVEARDTSHSRKLLDFSTTHERDKNDIESVGGNADCLDDPKKNKIKESTVFSGPSEKGVVRETRLEFDSENDLPSLGSMLDPMTAYVNSGDSKYVEDELTPLVKHSFEGSGINDIGSGCQMTESTSNIKENGRTTKLASSTNKENWIEKNFFEFEPLVERIGVGFRNNYVTAREKSNHELDSKVDIGHLTSAGHGNELEWMKDEKLREIVFKVRDNELSGRDPFHLMDEEDRRAFFIGLEKKVEQENKELLRLHEYFHENIENLDYGADGISLYDPPEKIIPRWKVSPAETNPDFLANFLEQRNSILSESLKSTMSVRKNREDAHQQDKPSSGDENSVTKGITNNVTGFRKEIPAHLRTIIERSDGSVEAGKKSGREYWQHTKKWSQGFLESYNSETDMEVKTTMKDIGKDLDRWITEKEIKDAADLLDKIPEKGKKVLKEKLDKVKREMELFGPQAVVSKYREYAEEKEEDYLWWLDLPFVLCIELYTVENGEQKVGLYSLEMGADMELDPKQYHVIAFEDTRDCNNLCYIIQAHMEMLGTGNAFVVARPPKDAFREAKANGFSVTVIRKGQLPLNIDQTLEEVDELIVEIGSKVYHDKIMQDRSADMKGLMKGVFGINKPSKMQSQSHRKSRSKRKPKRSVNP